MKPDDALISALKKLTLPLPPKGWKTLSMICEELGTKEKTTLRNLKLVGAKSMKCRGHKNQAATYYHL